MTSDAEASGEEARSREADDSGFAERPRGERPPPPWPIAYPPPFEQRPRRRFRGCLVILAGLVAGGLVAFFLPAFLGGDAMPGLAGAGYMDVRPRERFVGGEHRAEATIAVVDIKGVILSGRHVDAASTSYVNAALGMAAADPAVVAVVLDMNTPGGEVIASDEIHRAVQRVRAAGKPVVTCMRSLGASGGYYIAAGTDFIVANRMTLTGSIGVLMSSVNYSGLLNKIGVQAHVYASGEMKDILNGAVPRTPEERQMRKELLQDLVDDTFTEFASVVAAGRGFPSPRAVKQSSFGDGRVLSGEQAFELGLVDRLGYFSDAVEEAMARTHVSEARVVRYVYDIGLVDRLLALRSQAPALNLESLVPDEIRALRPGRLYYLMALSPDGTAP